MWSVFPRLRLQCTVYTAPTSMSRTGNVSDGLLPIKSQVALFSGQISTFIILAVTLDNESWPRTYLNVTSTRRPSGSTEIPVSMRCEANFKHDSYILRISSLTLSLVIDSSLL